MTIMGLFKKHGVNLTRSVSPTGQLQFAVAGSASLAGMPMPASTFHGGEEGEIEAAPDALARWWLDDNVVAREQEAMARWFPHFTEVLRDDAPPVWGGAIDTGRGSFEVLIFHRLDHGLPSVVPVKPVRGRQLNRRFAVPPHLYTSGNLCVASPGDWLPERDTTATAVAWAAHWFTFYVEWFYTQKWPADAYQPNAA